jgi:hypothetical protein
MKVIVRHVELKRRKDIKIDTSVFLFPGFSRSFARNIVVVAFRSNSVKIINIETIVIIKVNMPNSCGLHV